MHTRTHNIIDLQCSLPFFHCSLRYWLSFQSIVMPLLLSLLACCRSLWSMCVCVCVHLKGSAERKEKVTKESMCICYSLSAVLLTLQTPRDGFLVNVKRAGATDWFLWHAQKPFSRGYLHSFHPRAVKCILYCVAELCVCAQRLAVRGIMHCLSLFCQGMFVRSHIHQCRKTSSAVPPKGRCKLIATVCRINISLLLGEKLTSLKCQLNSSVWSLTSVNLVCAGGFERLSWAPKGELSAPTEEHVNFQLKYGNQWKLKLCGFTQH